MYRGIENQPLIFRTVRAIMFINQSIINLPADDKTAKASGYRIGVHGKPEMEDKTMENKVISFFDDSCDDIEPFHADNAEVFYTR